MNNECYQNGKLFVNGSSGPLKIVFKNPTKCSFILNIMLSVLVIFLLSNIENIKIITISDDYPNFLPEYSQLVQSSLVDKQNISLLCMVLTQKYHDKAVHVAATWGRRCTKLIFVSDVSDTRVTGQGNVDIVEMEGVTGRKHLWNKVKGKDY